MWLGSPGARSNVRRWPSSSVLSGQHLRSARVFQIDFFSYLDSVSDLDAKVLDGALDLGTAQELDRAQVAGLPIGQPP